MFKQTFYFSLIRKYVVYFGTLFNDITFVRYIRDPDAPHDVQTTNQLIKVPIQYAPKEKFLARLTADPDIDRPHAVVLPRMSFQMRGFTYDGKRKLQTVNKIYVRDPDNPSRIKYQFNPVPWDIDFELNVYVKNNEDGAKIIEQILPFFTPEWTSTLNVIPEMNVKMDVPVILKDVTQEDTYDNLPYPERRVLVWTLHFTMRAYFYGPIKKSEIILIANTPFYIANTEDITDSIGNVGIAEKMHVIPSIDANGNPLNYYGKYPAEYANGATSVPVTEINAEDDYGFTTEVWSVGNTFSNTG